MNCNVTLDLNTNNNKLQTDQNSGLQNFNDNQNDLANNSNNDSESKPTNYDNKDQCDNAENIHDNNQGNKFQTDSNLNPTNINNNFINDTQDNYPNNYPNNNQISYPNNSNQSNDYNNYPTNTPKSSENSDQDNYPTNYPNNYSNDIPNNSSSNNDNNNYPNNNTDNNQNNYPDNSPSNNENNSSSDNEEDSNLEEDDSTDSQDESIKTKRTKKHYKPITRPISSENSTDQLSSDSELNPENERISDFLHLLNESSRECTIYLFNFTNYDQGKNENCLIKFERSFKPTIGTDNFSVSMNMIPRVSSLTARSRSDDDNSLLSRSMSAEVYRKNINLETKVKLNQLKQLYLGHLYTQIPTDINDHLFIQQVTCYMRNQNNSLAHFQGFSMKDIDGNFLPTALTERPVNGPLSTLFSTVKSNQTKPKINIKRRSINLSDSFNIDKLETVTAEQKFSIIIGVIHGIAFIHDNGFIHSNLNPTTVYLNENLQSVICDYIFVPPFKVETLPEKDEYDQYQFKYSIKKEDAEELFKSDPFVAPEILNGGEFGQKSDIYSVGQIIRYILNDGELQDNFPENWGKIVQQCINEDPMKRPTAVDLLNELLKDENNAKLYVSSLSSAPAKISESTILYIKLIRKNFIQQFNNDSIDIDIFHTMIPNVIGIDEDTRLIVSAAEKGDVKSIEKVGDFFYKGENNFHQDEEWAYSCYKSAADLGSLYSMLQVAKFNEEGIGTNVNLNTAYEYYCKAKNCEEDVKKKEEIDQKLIKIDHKRRTIVLKNVPSTRSQQSLKIFFRGANIDSISFEKVDQKIQRATITFHTIKDLEQAKKIIKDKKSLQNFEYELLNQKEAQSHRFDSLSSNLPIIDLNDYYPGKGKDNFKLLGSGTFADTFLVYKKETEEAFAAKIFRKEITDNEINNLKREIIMASKFNHPSILKYVGFNVFSLKEKFNGFESGELKPTLLMSYIPNKSLKKFITSKKSKWNDTTKLKVIIGIASGLSEMYANNVIHRDLKPDNILLNQSFEPVICDLGCSRTYSSIEYLKMSDNVGTPIYMAPELYNSDYSPIYKYEVDSYSFGIILFQILTATPTNKIFPNEAKSVVNIRKYKLNNYVPKLPNDMCDVFKYLIKSCWNTCVDERPDPPTIYGILLNAIDNNEVLLKNADMDVVKEYISRLPVF